MTEIEWYKLYQCDHAHCPNECEHPQPHIRNNKMICGCCWFKYKEYVEIIPCTPEICD